MAVIKINKDYEVHLAQIGRHRTVLAFGVIESLWGTGASQMHKGIPHLHSETSGKVDFTAVTSGVVSETVLISNLEIESVTALTSLAGAPSFFNLQLILQLQI